MAGKRWEEGATALDAIRPQRSPAVMAGKSRSASTRP